MKFEELQIHEKVFEGIKAAGFTECTPVQAQTLPDALRGRDIAAQAQTGTGKTAAFLIAIFSRMCEIPPLRRGPSPRTLIIAPTRELAVQIAAEAKLLGKAAGFRIVPVYGGIDYQKQREKIADGVDVLIGTPGRLIDYLKQKVYSLRKTQFLVTACLTWALSAIFVSCSGGCRLMTNGNPCSFPLLFPTAWLNSVTST
jgi:ATP-dependent RNA helicase RhlB